MHDLCLCVTHNDARMLLLLQADERAEERLGALLNLYGALTHAPTLQRQVLLVAAEYARK